MNGSVPRPAFRIIAASLALVALCAPGAQPAAASSGEPEPARVALLVREANEADLAAAAPLAGAIEFLALPSGARPPDGAERAREVALAARLARMMQDAGFAPRFAVVRLAEFDAALPLSAPARVLPALEGQGFRTLVDLRAPRPAHPAATAALDATLARLERLVPVAPTGDFGRDGDGDGVVDPGSAAGELAAATRTLAVGAAERFLPALSPRVPPADRFPAEPLRSDPMNDARRGLSASSGRGGPHGRGPDLVAPGEPCPRTGETVLLGDTRHAALEVALLAEKARRLFRRLGHPDPSAPLLRALLAALTEDLSPGQFGEGRFREIAGRPDAGQGLGRPADLPDSLIPRYRDERRGMRARTVRLDLTPEAGAPRRVAVALDGPPGGFTLVVRRSDGTVHESVGEPGGRLRLVEFSAVRGFRYEALVRRAPGSRGPAQFAVAGVFK